MYRGKSHAGEWWISVQRVLFWERALVLEQSDLGQNQKEG